jgi:hypothetical protein
MAYTLNSAKDSKGDEDKYVAYATANAQKIYDYKALHGGDFEHAFQAVTGIPWPAGRSLKMKNYQAEMTKDRTVKSVLGKYVLPAAAAVLAPYALSALAGGGGAAAAAGSAGGVGIGETGATVGLGGSGFGAGTAATVGTGVAAGAKGGLWSKLAVPLLTTGITAGTDLLGTKMKVDADKAAAELQAKAAEEALAWQKGVYGQRQEQFAPAIGVGKGATYALGDLMGIPTPEGGYHAPPPPETTAPAPPTTPQAPGAPAAPSAGLTVQMRAPNGQVATIPADQVQHYLALGATNV